LELAYSPFATFTGADSFRYTIADNLGQPSGQATVTIEPSKAPRTNPDVAGGVAADNINIAVLNNDSAVQGQLDPSTVTIVMDPENGQAIPQLDGSITYVPDPGFFGVDGFQYTVSDTEGNVSDPTSVAVRAVESGLENPLMFGDVNANGEVTGLDALLIINRLTEEGGVASIPVGSDERGPNFYDVNGNLIITALDALLVINNIGNDAPIISAELVEQPILADMSSSSTDGAESESVDWLFEAAGADSTDQPKLVDASLAEIDEVVDLLAADKDDVDNEDADEESALADLAIVDLL
jgi:hypothetical protein